ncbi:YoaK family protein [Peterkaempfera sp. SMS 1(5)a]|uniref:YoaK family protein n=1 Tax=Peterkaempfera podocarpi TaxID=3232308 RepID=UPI003670CBEB
MDRGNPGGQGPGEKQVRGVPLPAVLTVLTAVSGLIDAISYLGLGHVFTANMTGNVVIIAFAVAGAPGFSLVASVVSLGAFVTGAIAAGRLSLAMGRRPRHQWVRAALVVEAVLLLAASAVAFAVPSGARYWLIVLTAVAMGMRNGTVRKLAIPDLTTTVLTLTVTGLAFDSSLAGGTNPRVGRRTGAVVAMLAGGVVGALLVLHHGLGWPLLVSAVVVAAMAMALQRTPDSGE